MEVWSALLTLPSSSLISGGYHRVPSVGFFQKNTLEVINENSRPRSRVHTVNEEPFLQNGHSTYLSSVLMKFIK